MATPNWDGLEGALLPGGYEVEQCLSAGTSSATFKVRILGDRFTQTSGEFFAPGALDLSRLELWQQASQLRHPNVCPPLVAGLHELNGEKIPYLVTARPEETLDEVLRERALSAEEARDITQALAQGLSFLHGSGLVQFVLRPKNIAAIRENVCLYVTDARRINTPLEPGEEPSPAHDMQLLGELLFEGLTQKPASEITPEKIAELPAPFNTIVRRCVGSDGQKRCTPADVKAILRGEGVPVVAPVATKPVVTVSAAPIRAAVDAGRERVRAHSRTNLWLYVPVAAIVIAVLLLWGFRHKDPNVPAAATSAQAWPSREVGPATAPASVTPPRVTRQAAGPSGVPVSKPNSAAAGSEVWRVVSYTYARQSDAEKRARAINEKHPALHAEVFSPKGGTYLVALGGRMSREEAQRLRQRARASGLPRDTYIQNYAP